MLISIDPNQQKRISDGQLLLAEIEDFLVRSGMGGQYFGQIAASNPKLVPRLRKGAGVRAVTVQRVRRFIESRSQSELPDDVGMSEFPSAILQRGKFGASGNASVGFRLVFPDGTEQRFSIRCENALEVALSVLSEQAGTC